MIAVTHTMTLGKSVGPAVVVQGDAAFAPSPRNAGDDFSQTLAKGDTDQSDTDKTRFGDPADNVFKEALTEKHADIAPDLPQLDSAFLPSATHAFHMAAVPEASLSPPAAEAQLPTGDTARTAPVSLRMQTAVVADAVTPLPDKSGGVVGQLFAAINGQSNAKAKVEAPENAARVTQDVTPMRGADTENLTATAPSSPIAPTVHIGGILAFPDRVLPKEMLPAQVPNDGNSPPSVGGHRSTATAAAHGIAQDIIGLQSISPTLADTKFAADPTPLMPGDDQATPPPIVTMQADVDARLSVAENGVRAKWGDADPVVKGITGSDPVPQTRPYETPDLVVSAHLKTHDQPLITVRHASQTSVIPAASDAEGLVPMPHMTGAPNSGTGPTLIADPAHASLGFDATLVTGVSFDAALSPFIAASAVSPSPTAAALSAVPTAPPAIAPTIVEMARAGSEGPIDLALAPEELGRLTISILQEGDFVRVSMLAERPETLDLLRRHAGDLLADLRQSGFSGASFSFGQSGQDRAAVFAPALLDADDAAAPQSARLELKPSPPSRSHNGAGLDLRF